MDRKVTYDEMRKVLLDLGYVHSSGPNSIVFRHPRTKLPIVLRKFRRNELLHPADFLSIQVAVAHGDILPKEKFEAKFVKTPLQLWHAIIDAEAEFENEHGGPPRLLKLPILLAYDLAKLKKREFELSDRVMRDGIKVFETEGLLGIPVKLIHGHGNFEFE